MNKILEETYNNNLKNIDYIKKKNIIEKLFYDLHIIMEKWCKTYKDDFTGGKMREDRGCDLENFVRNTINYIGIEYKINLIAKNGNYDKKILQINTNGKNIKKNHQVDIHIYLDDNFIGVIECKAYLDSCYYVRACDDFKLFKKFDYNIKNFIFTLENSIDSDTKDFTDYITDNICDNIFYMLNGKRSSKKPIYDDKYKKSINMTYFTNFIDQIYILAKI